MEDEKLKEIIYLGLSSFSDLVLIFEENGKIIYANEAATSILDFSPEELTQNSITTLESTLEPESSRRARLDSLNLLETYSGISPRKRKDGRIVYMHETIVPVKFEGKKFFVLVGRDLKSEAFSSLQTNPMASFDIITGFPHIRGFTEVLATEIFGRRRRRINLLALDICHFSSIRLVHGTEFSQKLLRSVAQRLKEGLPSECIFGATEKDELLVAVCDLRRDELSKFVKRVLDLFVEPFVIDGKRLALTVNLGICSFPYDARDVLDMIGKAFFTLEQSKRMGENAYLFYSKDLDTFVKRYVAAREEIIEALDEGRVVPYGQLIFSLRDKVAKGLEVLSRIVTKDGTIVSPGTFVSLFEETGLITRLDDVLFDSLKKSASKLEGIFMSINVSPISARSPETIEKLKILKSHLQVPLYCEIMETSLLDEGTLPFLKKLKEAGIKIAVDDFGKGYNSLSYLRHFSIDMVKIDMDFVRKVSSDPRTFSIVHSVVELCRKLKIETCAEGVETKDQARVLNLIFCDLAQGFHFFKPAPLSACIEYFLK